MGPINALGEKPRNALEQQRKVEEKSSEPKRVEEDAVRITRSNNAPAPSQVAHSEPKVAAGSIEASEPSENDLEHRQELDRTA